MLLVYIIALLVGSNDMVALLISDKPLEYEAEELDLDDPSAMYFVYLCRMERKLARQKVERKGQLERKAKKAKEKKRKGFKNTL